jgi:hypothetical protein
MPVSPALAENLAREVTGYYAEAERLMLERIARNLAKGIAGPEWAQAKLAQMRVYQAQTERLIADLAKQTESGVKTALTEAYERGGLAAVEELTALRPAGSVTKAEIAAAIEKENAARIAWEEAIERGAGARNVRQRELAYKRAKAAYAHARHMPLWAPPSVEPLAGLRAIEALTQEATGNLLATHPRILRSTMDVYRSVIAETSEQVLLGTQTRLQAAQAALDRFAQKGITGFIDKAGRGWTLESYAEMAMRTSAGRAAVQGHADRLTANGLDLVIVSDAPRECPLCRPHEGKVYSLSGLDPQYPPLEEARAEGLFHVNCRHSISAYQPGVTPPMGDVADPEGYRATEQLRYLERKVRESKRLEAAAMDETARLKAMRRKRDYQAKIRAHVASTSAKRQPHRERLGAL